MNFTLFKAEKGRKKWSIRGNLFDGSFVKIPGSRDRVTAEQMRKNIEILNRCRKFGEPPTPDLAAWIEGLPREEAERYADLGLLERKYLDRQRALVDLLPDFHAYLQAKNEAGTRHVPEKIQKIRRVLSLLKPNISVAELTEDDVLNAVKQLAFSGPRKHRQLSQKTQREYLLAVKSFCKWMVVKGRAAVNPLNDIKVPAAKAAPVRNRRPLTVQAFAKLARCLLYAPLVSANGCTYSWKREDRLMTYWMAVLTGLRAKELKSLTLSSINFECNPAEVTIEGWHAKNRTKSVIPLEAKLATALKQHCEGRSLNEPLLRMPHLNSVTQYFARDLDMAGIPRRFADGWVTDFHALRCTAICWWLTVNNFNLLEVQFLARLKTLTLVQQYARGFKPDYGKLTREGPDIIEPQDLAGRLAG